ncbi:MAG: hypothetical protein WCK39_04735 [Methanomassiliicoccales archaeon]
MAPVEDTQVNRLAILAAARVGLHELRKTAVARPRLITLTYFAVGAVLILLSGWGENKGLLAAAGVVTLIMAAAVYMDQRQDRACNREIENYEKALSDLVGNGGSLAEADGTSVAGSVLDTLAKSQEWSKALLREYGTHLVWVLVTAAVLAAASGMANEGGQMVTLQIGAVYLALSVLASDFRSMRTLLAWRKAVRSAQETEQTVFDGMLVQSMDAPERDDIDIMVRFLEKLDNEGGSSQRTPLQLAVGVDHRAFMRHLNLLVSKDLATIQRDEKGTETVLLTAKGRELYRSLLALLERTLRIGF